MRVDKSDLDDAVVEDGEAAISLKSDSHAVTAKSRGKWGSRILELDKWKPCLFVRTG